MMEKLPVRKHIRIDGYDYSLPGAYFITICTKNRTPIFWNTNKIESNTVGADIIRPPQIPLSEIGQLVRQSINQISKHYENVKIDKYVIMPDHVHIILSIIGDENGRMISAPTISTIIGSMKRWVSKNIGRPIWQRSFYDHGIRNKNDYKEIWEYIENNPYKYL